MDNSPKGREIDYLEGDPDPIIARGNAITKLGNQMISSAAMLQKIADGAIGQKGLAIDKMKDKVGDSYKDLKLAGERYQPTGPLLVTYGQALSEIKPKISTSVQNCESDWATYQAKLGDVSDAHKPTAAASGTEPADDGSSDAAAQAQAVKDAVGKAQGVADNAHDNWEAEAKIFDSHYDTWEDAFNTAADGIHDAIKGGISDGFWDNLDGFVAAALKVLQVIGVILAIACIIIGGPLLAAIAACVAIATLALTIYSFARGNSNGWDLAFAIVGVIPFGSVGKLFSGGKMEFVNEMAGGLLKSGTRSAVTGEFGNLVHGVSTGFTRGGGGLAGTIRGLKGGYNAIAGPAGKGLENVISRAFTGYRASHWSVPNLPAVHILGSVWGDAFAKGGLAAKDGVEVVNEAYDYVTGN